MSGKRKKETEMSENIIVSFIIGLAVGASTIGIAGVAHTSTMREHIAYLERQCHD